MSPKSLKTIERLKELSEDPERLKRFVRAQDLAKQYNVWPSTIRRVAKRCGALCVVNDIALVDLPVFEPYYLFKRMQKEEK